MPYSSVADLEMAVLRAGGLTGSLSDMRKGYALQADAANVTAKMSLADSLREWWSAGAGDTMTNLTDLERRYYLGSSVRFGPSNSVSDLRYEKFGGSVA